MNAQLGKTWPQAFPQSVSQCRIGESKSVELSLVVRLEHYVESRGWQLRTEEFVLRSEVERTTNKGARRLRRT